MLVSAQEKAIPALDKQEKKERETGEAMWAWFAGGRRANDQKRKSKMEEDGHCVGQAAKDSRKKIRPSLVGRFSCPNNKR